MGTSEHRLQDVWQLQHMSVSETFNCDIHPHPYQLQMQITFYLLVFLLTRSDKLCPT